MTGMSGEMIWQNLPNPALVLDSDLRIVAVNGMAELFFGLSAKQVLDRPLSRFLGSSSRIEELVRRVLSEEMTAAEYDYELSWPDTPPRLVDAVGAPLSDGGEQVILLIHPRSIAASMDRSLNHRAAARSVSGMAAMLAHEIKNPLAGISGAAQLLELNSDESDRELATLIREEVDRIGKLMASFEQFGDIAPVEAERVNIHDVLDRAKRAAKAGFAAHIRFVEEYDPSLPPVMGDSDRLMQVFMNLLKNAAEAAPSVGGVIILQTAYRAGMKVLTPSGRRESLPLQIRITDNGQGVAPDILRDIFEPFVTSKGSGSGLGLSLVSKIIADHGGVISCESEPGWTRFSIRLPVAPEPALKDLTNEVSA
ncbi:MAG: ATP-binding protein [Pseudomonadota bacterium]